MAGRATGSWTFVSSWRDVVPDEVAASMIVLGTWRMPTSTRRMTGGNAKITAAMMAVNRPAPKSTNAGRM